MTWRLAHSLVVLRDEVNARWPQRSKVSDGTIGDQAHANTGSASDHNPWLNDTVRAFDITTAGIDAPWLAEHFRKMGAAGDVRLLDHGYVIFDGRIASETGAWAWRSYTGSDPHTSHIHISVSRTPSAYDMPAQWGLTAQIPTPEDDLPLNDADKTFIDQAIAKWVNAREDVTDRKIDALAADVAAIKKKTGA